MLALPVALRNSLQRSLHRDLCGGGCEQLMVAMQVAPVLRARANLLPPASLQQASLMAALDFFAVARAAGSPGLWPGVPLFHVGPTPGQRPEAGAGATSDRTPPLHLYVAGSVRDRDACKKEEPAGV